MSSHSRQRQPWISGLHGGRRPRAGRPQRDTVRVQCSIPRSLYEELVVRETMTGVYRTQIAATILTEELVGGLLNRSLKGSNDLRRSTEMSHSKERLGGSVTGNRQESSAASDLILH